MGSNHRFIQRLATVALVAALCGCNKPDAKTPGGGTDGAAPAGSATAKPAAAGKALVHSVFFWLKADKTAEQKEAFKQGLLSLKAIESVKELYVGGSVSGKEGGPHDRSFSFALTVIFDDAAGLAAYLPHPVHKKFLDNFAADWEKVTVRDDDASAATVKDPDAAPFVHSVYFWLSEGTSDADKKAVREGLESLKGVDSVRRLFVGTPAPGEDRDVIDKSYDLGLVVVYDDAQGEKDYNVHPVHTKFVETYKKHFGKVIVLDSE